MFGRRSLKKRNRPASEPSEPSIPKKPIWTNPNPDVVPAATSADVRLSSADLLAFEFQVVLRKGNLADILTSMQACIGADNRTVYVVNDFGKPANLFRLWSTLPNPPAATTPMAQMPVCKQLYSIFCFISANATGLNQADADDGLRPIDVANPVQKITLIAEPTSTGVDLTPTLLRSPLYDVISRPDDFMHLGPIIDRMMDVSALDWSDAAGRTILHVACGLFTHRRPEVIQLLSNIGFVNPSHPCFQKQPITEPAELVRLLDFARSKTAVYRSVHLANQIANAAPTMPTELISIVSDYAL